MCGICGIFSFEDKIKSLKLLQMTKLMRHRGPDDEGYILFSTEKNKYESFHSDDTIKEIKAKTKNINDSQNIDYNLGFGFRRLSILDLSERGHQPMTFEEAGLHIVFNGQIYNYIEIREELKSFGYKFISNSDTEVILKSYHKWGEICVNKFNGMWAFAIWDMNNKKLFCSRDRFAVKPFYYYYIPGKIFIFSSEIKPLLLFVKPEENLNVISNNFAFGISDYNKETFFKNIYQLNGSHNLTVINGCINIYKYYSISANKCNYKFEKAKEILKELLFDAVKIRLRSDVEVGYALSGGIDSSAIVCIASELKSSNNHTFSMVIPGSSFDEEKYVNLVISKTNFKKHTIIPSFEDFMNDLDNFVYCHEEPFGGLSFYGEYKIRQLTYNSNIKVSLDGQGADEVFAGYPSVLIYFFKDLIRNLKLSTLNKEFRNFNKQNDLKVIKIFKNFFKNEQRTNINFIKKKYPYINTELLLFENSLLYPEFNNCISFNSHLNKKLYALTFYISLPRLLAGADKVSMYHSIETRNPFLDFRVVEFGLSLPYSFKINNGFLKYILRESVKEIIPKGIYLRKDKIGFVLPENKFTDKHLFKKIKDIIFSIDISNTIINLESFKNYYFNGDKKEGDWKFWKTVSYLLWYNKFIGSKLNIT